MKAASDLITLPDLLRYRARLEPDRPFVSFKDRAFTYGSFDARTDELAGELHHLGPAFRPGRSLRGRPAGGAAPASRRTLPRRAHAPIIALSLIRGCAPAWYPGPQNKNTFLFCGIRGHRVRGIR